MPVPLPVPDPPDVQLRRALYDLLDRLGAMPSATPRERTDEQLVWLADHVRLGREEFAVCPEVDDGIPF